MDAVGAFCGCGSGKHRFFSCCEHTDSPYRRYGTRRLLRCNKLVSSYDLISAVKTLCVQNLQSGTDLPEFQRLLLPRSAREGEVAFSKKMTEGMCSKFQSAPKPAAFGSPQSASLTASLPLLAQGGPWCIRFYASSGATTLSAARSGVTVCVSSVSASESVMLSSRSKSQKQSSPANVASHIR